MNLEELNVKKNIVTKKLIWGDKIILKIARLLKITRIFLLPLSLIGIIEFKGALIRSLFMDYFLFDYGIHRKQAIARHKQEKIILKIY